MQDDEIEEISEEENQSDLELIIDNNVQESY